MTSSSPMILCLALLLHKVHGFSFTSSIGVSPSPNRHLSLTSRFYIREEHHRYKSALKSTFEEDAPSDYGIEDIAPTQQELNVDSNSEDKIIREELKKELLLLSSITNRGIYASDEERDILTDIVTQLEALNPTADPAANCEGEWDLCCTSTQLFRSSPFFQALRVVLSGDDEKTKDSNQSFSMSDNFFDLHDLATSVGRVGRVKQTIEKMGDKLQMRNEIGLNVGIAGGIPFRLSGTVISTANLNVASESVWEMKVQNVQVKNSNLPFLDTFASEIPVGSVYEMVGGDVPSAKLRTFYVDEGIRITRDVDDNFYVFSRS